MTNNLGFTLLSANQANKYDAVNDMFGEMDASLTEQIVADFTSVATITLTASELARNVEVLCENVTVSGRTLVIPADSPRLFLVTSDSSNTQTMEIDKGTSTITLPTGATVIALARNDTNSLDQVATSASASNFLELTDTPSSYSGAAFNEVRVNSSENALQFIEKAILVRIHQIGTPSASLIIHKHVFTEDTEFNSGFSGSRGHAGTVATANTTLDVHKNGVSIGSIKFNASATVATYTLSGANTFVAGDYMDIIAPGTPDATLADFAITIEGHPV